MLEKIYYYSHTIFFRSCAIALISSIVLIGSFFTWVATGPRSLTYFTPYIASQLTNMGNHVSVNIQNSLIRWDGVKKQIVISAQHVEVLDSTNDPLVTIPEISFELNVLRLLLGNFLSSEITVLHPTLYLTTNHQHIYVRSQKDLAAPRNVLDIIRSYIKDDQKTFDISRINLEDASIYIDNGETNSLWTIKQGFAQINKKFRKGKRTLHSEFSLQSGATAPIQWSVTATETVEHTLDIGVATQKLPSTMLQDLFPAAPWLEGVNAVFDGEIHLLLTDEKTPPTITFSIQNSKGDILFPDYFQRNIAFDDLTITGSYSFEHQELTLTLLSTQLDPKNHGPTITLKGVFTNLLPFSLSGAPFPKLAFSTTVNNLEVRDLADYWPVPIRHALREWITSRITTGHISSASGDFVITPEDFALLKKHEEVASEDPDTLKDLPIPSENMIHASIHLEDATVLYHPLFPAASHVNAVATFNHKGMLIDVSKGSILDSTITHAQVAIENMWLKPSYITVNGDVTGKAENMIEYLKASLPEKDVKTPQLKSIYHLTGSATGHIELGFPMKPTPLLYDDLDLKIHSTFTDTHIPNFMDTTPIEHGAFDIDLNNRFLTITGKGKIQDIPFTTVYSYNFSLNKNKPFTSQNHLQASVTADQLRSLHIADIPYLSLPFDVDVTLTERTTGVTDIKGTANLTKANIAWPEYHFIKAPGKAAILAFDGNIQEQKLSLSNFSLKGDTIDIQGKATLSGTSNPTIEYLAIPVLKFGQTHMSLLYEHKNTGYSMDINGDTIDLSNAPINHIFKQTKLNQAVHLKVRLKDVVLKNNVHFTNLTADVACSPLVCQSMEVHSTIGKDEYVNATLKPIANRNVLLVDTNNAGLLITGLGISEHIKNGLLHIQTTAAKDEQGNLITEGTVHIEHFNAIKPPLLSRLLTLASLKGFTDLLEQQGMSFDQFEAPITISNGIITIKDARTAGSSIGITGDGTINTNTNNIDIKGVLVPAQELNKLISKIPLIGNIIIGGKNQGIIATTYRIEGTYEDAKISVNPLSILTPSFLRKIFNMLPHEKK